jgi:hypothetical protein
MEKTPDGQFIIDNQDAGQVLRRHSIHLFVGLQPNRALLLNER